MTKLTVVLLAAVAAVIPAIHAQAQAPRSSILRVGKGETYSLPSQAAAAAQDGDTIEIDAGVYPQDVALWRANHLKIRGIGGRAVLDSQGRTAQQKAIWIIDGADTLVENIEFTGAAVPDKNGAGIRQEGPGLTVRNCYFHDNEDGILAGPNPESDILVENTEFNHNGHGDGQSHNIYIGQVRRFIFRGCFSHNANEGHDLKSRALVNEILYNRITDDDNSNTSYLIDLPNGGLSFIIGNLIRRGPNADNATLINFAEEGAKNPQQALYVVNNTLVNDRHAAVFIHAMGQPTVRVVDNLFVGNGQQLTGATGDVNHNLAAQPSDLQDAAAFDYRLKAGSAAIDAGVDPGSVDGYSLSPRFEYLNPASLQPRPVHGALDAGAYEAE